MRSTEYSAKQKKFRPIEDEIFIPRYHLYSQVTKCMRSPVPTHQGLVPLELRYNGLTRVGLLFGLRRISSTHIPGDIRWLIY